MITRRALLGAAAALAFSGCGRRPRDDGRKVATLWYSYGGKNREVLESLVRRFHAEQREVFVEATFQGDYFESLAKLRTALAAHAAPTFSHVVGEVVPYLARADVLEPLDGYDGAGALGLVPALAQAGSYDGGAARPLVAIPFNRSTPILYVNATMLARAGVRVPATWDELAEAARALTVRRGGETSVWGYECPISWWFWVAMLGAFGGRLVDGADVPTLGGAAGERALELWQTMVHRDRSMRPPPGRDYNAWQASMQDFLAGRAAIIASSTAFVRYVEESAKFPVRAAPMPSGTRRSVPTGGTFFVVLRGAPDDEKRAAWRFLRWMVEPRQTIEWATKTGYMPVSNGAIAELEANGWYAAHPNDRVAVGQLADAAPWPWSPELFRIQREVVEPRLEDAVLMRRDPGVALAEARREALGG